MTTLTDKFDELEDLLAGQATTLGAYIDTVETKLQSVLDLMDIMNENNAANTKALLAAVGQSAACFPCPTPSIVVPPIGSTSNPIDEDHCKRAQAFLATLSAIFTGMDTLQSFNVVGSYNVINDAISEVVGALAGGTDIPLPSFPEVVNIVGDYISYAGERAFSGIGIMEQFTPLIGLLRNGLYSSTTPEAAQSVYNSTIEGSTDTSNGARLLFEATAYTALYNYFFDPSSTPDLSAFDGSLCAIPVGTCYTLVSETVCVPALSACEEGIVGSFASFPAFSTVGSTSGPVAFDKETFFTGSMVGWTYEVLAGQVVIQYRDTGIDASTDWAFTFPKEVDGTPVACPTPTGTFHFRDPSPFTVRMCFVGV